MAKILVVEDDHNIADSIKELLDRQHYLVEVAHRGDDALAILAVSTYDLVILDWNMPAHTGPEICSWMRTRGIQSAVLMLTARAEVSDKVTGLDCGADDYLTKPFLPHEFAARVRALLRRPAAYTPSDCIVHGVYKLFPTKHRLEKDGTKVALQPQEFALVEFFFKHPDEVFSVEALLKRVWPAEVEPSEDALRGCIKRVRKKLDDQEIVENVHGAGYKLGKGDG